jgi:hypothetical protein
MSRPVLSCPTRASFPLFARFPVLSAAGSAVGALLGSAALAAFMTLAVPLGAHAQSATPAPAKAGTAAPASAKQASVSKDAAAVKKPANSPTKSSGKKSAKKAEPQPEPEVEITAADEQQLAAAKEVLLGESGCEFNQKIQVNANAQHPGYVDMSFNQKKYTMKPILSPTGALRLEDVRREALMIQIASKTMVMNQKTGQRLVDNCVHPEQRTVSADSSPAVLLK